MVYFWDGLYIACYGIVNDSIRVVLPAPSRDRLQTGDDGGAPETEMERILARMWGEVIGVETVKRHDNLFDLGGHSPLAIQVLSIIQKALGLDLSLKFIFDWPILADQALKLLEMQSRR